jgi:hypothetical protein
MDSNNTSTDAQNSSSALGRRSFLQEAGALAGAGALTALAGCSGSGDGPGGSGGGSNPTPEPKKPDFPLTASVSEPYYFYRHVLEYEDRTDYERPVWYVDLTFDLAVDVDDWKGTFPSTYLIRVSENGGNPNYANIFRINKDEDWYRIEDRWQVKKSHFVVDGTETEYLVLGYDEDNEPDVGTDYAVYLEDPAGQDFHELVTFSYDGDPTRRSLLDEEFWD